MGAENSNLTILMGITHIEYGQISKMESSGKATNGKAGQNALNFVTRVLRTYKCWLILYFTIVSMASN